jgi:hypothetical protein
MGAQHIQGRAASCFRRTVCSIRRNPPLRKILVRGACLQMVVRVRSRRGRRSWLRQRPAAAKEASGRENGGAKKARSAWNLNRQFTFGRRY